MRLEFGQEHFKCFTLIQSRILFCTKSILFWLTGFQSIVLVLTLCKFLQNLLKINYFSLLIVLFHTFDFEHVTFVLFVFYILTILEAYSEPSRMSGVGFFAKIVNDIKPLIVFANGFNFDV